MKCRRIHILGIGGVGMASLAELLLAEGYCITASDLRPSTVTRRLSERGAQIAFEPKAEWAEAAALFVYPAQIAPSHPEWLAAQAAKVPCMQRSEALLWLSPRLKRPKWLVLGAAARGLLCTLLSLAENAPRCGGALLCDESLGDAAPSALAPLLIELDERDFFERVQELLRFDPERLFLAAPAEARLGYYAKAEEWQAFKEALQSFNVQSLIAQVEHREGRILVEDCRAGQVRKQNFHYEAQAGNYKLWAEGSSLGLTKPATPADLSAYALALYHQQHYGRWAQAELLARFSALSVQGYFEPFGELQGQIHEIRMHPAFIAEALQSLASLSGGQKATLCLRPYAPTLLAYGLDIWVQTLRLAKDCLLIEPPYEGCPGEAVSALEEALRREGLKAQRLSLEQVHRHCQDLRPCLYVGAPDILPSTP